jgi:hypothetical protein
MMSQKLKNLFLIQSILSFSTLFLPFVFMKIGPGGYAFYGPDVPDIWIVGGFIFGKDISWWGINFAFKFQLVMILFCTGLSALCYRNKIRPLLIYLSQAYYTVMLLAFPYWVWMYTGGVRSNSDCADLTIYPHIGWIVYLGLICLQIIIFVNIKRRKNGIQTAAI